MAKRIWKAKDVIKGWQDKPIRIQQFEDPFDEDSIVEVGDMRVLDAMLVIANRFDCKTLDDASKKRTLKKALLASVKTGRIELEPDIYKWLKVASEQVCPMAWQDNANEVHDIISEGFRYENEPSESAGKAKVKKGEDAPPTEEPAESCAEEK